MDEGDEILIVDANVIDALGKQFDEEVKLGERGGARGERADKELDDDETNGPLSLSSMPDIVLLHIFSYVLKISQTFFKATDATKEFVVRYPVQTWTWTH